MEGEYIGTHRECGGRIYERILNKGKYGRMSFHWICNSCGKQPESRDIHQREGRKVILAGERDYSIAKCCNCNNEVKVAQADNISTNSKRIGYITYLAMLNHTEGCCPTPHYLWQVVNE